MKVEITARWGNFKPGDVVDVGGNLGRWLVGNNRAKAISSAPQDKMVKTSQNKGIASGLYS